MVVKIRWADDVIELAVKQCKRVLNYVKVAWRV